MNHQTVQQSSLLAASNIIYVNTNVAGGKKDGTSWENAFLDLQSALSKAKTGDQIWIAQGTYTPTRLDDVRDARTAHFKMKNGVAIYGGFKGDSDEETVENRDFTHNKTILSGALPSGEAAYHVFYHPNNYDLKLNATAILDGVTISAGHADGYLTSHKHGGGMYNSGNNPTLRNVIFYGNKANYFGGGMYNLQSSPTLMNVEFTDNEANSGGGIFNWNESAPKITNVVFNKNKATRSGGGIQNNSCDIIIEHAKFTNNEAAHGGGIANYGNSASTLTDVTFSQNIASQQGGGIYNNGPGNKSILTNVMFEQNKAAYFGGGIVNDRESSPKFTDVIFRNNESDSGGAMFNANRSAPELNNVEFHGNIAISRGGGIYNRLQSNPLITNVIFNGNKSELGGGLLNESGNPSLINALFISNNANKGSALYNIFADFSLINATIYSNSPAAIYGGAANSKIINSIIIGNGHTAALTDYQGQTTNSLLDVPVEKGYKGQLFDATSNPTGPATYVPDDVFVSPTSGNLHLKVGGPAIDAGNSDAHSIATDLAGKRRIQGAAIDLGVYETTPYYTVTYNANGATSGTVPQDSTQYEENKIVTVQGNSGNLVKDGYLFAGWNTQADGQGEPYFADETFQIGTTDVILYAQWIKNHYTVTYDANGATSGQVPQDSALYEENEVVTVQGNSGNLVRDGYLFAGWNTQADGQGAAYNANATFQIGTADVILYAQWTKPNTSTYTVTYDANGATSGTVPQDSTQYEENKTVTVQGNSGQLVRTGYMFAGWNTQADGQGTAYNANETFPIGTADVILYAHWTKPNTPTYIVTYHANGATSGTVPQDSALYEENETVTVQGNSGNLVREGYLFAGWNTQADGQGTAYNANATFQIGTADVILYAQWTKPNTPTYTVTYHANGATSGTVPQDSTQYEENKTVTVQGNSGQLVRTGYTFAGWNTQADGQGEPYFADETFQIGTTDVILYAQWIKNHYTVTYDANGATSGTVPQDSALYEENEMVTVQGNSGNLVRDGYLFAGWNTQADGQGKLYFADETFQMGTEDVILYAQWTKPNTPTYTVTYDANGAISGTVPQDSALYEENDVVTVQGNSGNLVRDGYLFAGWNTQVDGQGTMYQANDVFPIGTADVILYAQWTKTNTPAYTVTYDANGATSGTVPQDSTQYEENKTVTVQGNSGQLVRTGYTFTGWNTQADGKGISYAENATFQMGKADVTLYAQWASNPSTPNEGNVTGPSTSEGNNSANPSRSIQISLETNGGLSLKDIEIAYNTTVSDLPIPTREGYRFAGWYQDKELTKPWDKRMLVKESLTLYAKWTALPEEEAINSQPPKTPQPLPPIVTFQDIENHWAQEIIEALATQGVITGYKDGTFRPNETISRQHVAVLLTRAFTFEASRPSIAFSDVAPHHPYYHEITILQQAGIIDGIDGAFHPADHLTRAQLAKILANTLQLQPQTTSSFTDVDSSHWSAGYIGALERAGIALGDNGKFRPEASVTRAQLAAFLYRAMQQ
ncbi:InlB B-repeat-containing protein [Lysinibacillus sphaericus]|nr:InlB B-repeat-containing protein [Lysinibacillus sphaericus]